MVLYPKMRDAKIAIALYCLSVFLLAGCVQNEEIQMEEQTQENQAEEPAKEETKEAEFEVATFAGGCFWCTESDFEKQEGVIEVISGYTGGQVENPTYKEVSAGTTGHAEAIKVTYDPSKITYQQLLDVFWRHHDPTDAGGSFVDRGNQYRSAIFYHNETQKELAERSKKLLEESGRLDGPIATEIAPAGEFFPAEEYHQDYHTKNPIRYKFYRGGSGRDAYIKETWGDDKPKTAEKIAEEDEEETADDTESSFDPSAFKKPSEEELKEMLTELQFEVTQEDGTERPFENEYNDNKEEGIYVDIVSGEPLFSSTDKFDSGTGWPSFTKPIDDEYVVTKKDYKLLLPRTEVRSKYADSHLGHVFKDGPEPTGLRYCMNSASLRFIPKDKLEDEGYSKYMELFE